MKEIILRTVAGGVVVSTFAILADLLKPKSFAGLFGAAPSIALATLFLTVAKDGKQYAAMEGRSMILGALAFFLYAWVISRVLFHRKMTVFAAASGGIVLWLGCAIGLWYAVLR